MDLLSDALSIAIAFACFVAFFALIEGLERV
jgi:hypothetical protein